MRGFSLTFLSLLAATNAAVVLPRQSPPSVTGLPDAATSLLSAASTAATSLSSVLSSAVAGPTSTGSVTSASSASAPSSTTSSVSSSSSSSSSSTTSASPSSTILYVAPTSTAIGTTVTGKANGNETDASSNARCTRSTFQVPVNTTSPSFNTTALGVFPEVNQTRITDLFVEFVTSQDNFTQAYANGTYIINETFNISGVYCEPTNATANGAIQLLVHGIGFDSSYWNIRSDEYDLPEEEYSYVYQAHKAGYSTFRFDRLGNGQSERPADGYNLVTAQTEVAILENLADRLRNTSDIGNSTWNQTVLVGHSYGSVQSQRLAQIRPELIDALVLTGYSTDLKGFPYTVLGGIWTQAGDVFPERFANISKDWLVTATEYANQILFTYPPSIGPNTTTYLRATTGPVVQAAFFTIGDLGAPADNYTGPVQVVLGEKDFIFAFNQPFVNGTNLADASIEALFPQAAEGSTGSIIPATGHAINAHSTAPIAYNATLSFLNSTLFANSTGSTAGAGGDNSTTSSSTSAPLPSTTGSTSSASVSLPTATTTASA